MENERDKRIISTLMTLTIIFTLIGGTLSYLKWQSSEAQKTNVVFTIAHNYSCAADGGGNIVSANLLPANCTNPKYAIQRTITVTPTIKASGMTLGIDLWLDINELGSGLSKSEYFKYALTTEENSCTTGIVSEGKFTGLSSENNDKVMLLNQQGYTTSDPQIYYLYIWIDPLEENNYITDQTFNFSLGGSCTGFYTINYDLNGGVGNFETQKKDNDETIILSNEIPTKEGYIFKGWGIIPEAITPKYQPGDEYTNNSNAVLYAIWGISPINSYSCSNGSAGSDPYDIVFNKKCTVIDDGDNNWRIKFLESGTLTVNKDMLIDAFLVGGGGGGVYNASYGGGGGGGYTTTRLSVTLHPGQPYEIVVGGGGGGGSGSSTGGTGGTTSAFSVTAAGGRGGENAGRGGAGGSGGGEAGGVDGGTGGSNGSNGFGTYGKGGVGQELSTHEFGNSNLTLYSGGGGGGAMTTVGTGGSGGGGRGAGGGISGGGVSGGANTGGGGGGGAAGSGKQSGGAGGSGIVVIRNAQGGCGSEELTQLQQNFAYFDSMCYTIDDGDGNWRIKFVESGTLIPYENMSIDAFLVGGGGGGGGGVYNTNYGSGGGGGYTTTQSDITLVAGEQYQIVIGSGGAGGGSGSSGSIGGTTSAFSFNALGGQGGTNYSVGGAGGSGGGGAGSGGNLGGDGGSNGSNGFNSYTNGGQGQGISTYEFGDSTLTIYSGGGAGGGNNGGGTGGSGGGGRGAGGSNAGGGVSGSKNSGGGGGGGGAGTGNQSGGRGGTGIVVIRNQR